MRLKAAGMRAPKVEYLNCREIGPAKGQGEQAMSKSVRPKASACKAACLAVVLTASALPLSGVQAAAATGGDTVQGLYDALLRTMRNGRTLGQSGRFTQLEPVIRRSFDIPTMTRLSVG